MTRTIFSSLALFLCLSLASAQPKERPKLTEAKVLTVDHVYKKTDEGELTLHCFMPDDWKATDKRPVIVFFHGGAWKNGAYTQFVPQSEYFATRGIVAISADYRILNKHKTMPDKAIEDAKTAIRWVRANSAKLGIDPDKVIAGGGSAGGHLAAAAALVEKFEDKDDPKASCKPNALVLFNPFLNGKGKMIPGTDGTNISEAMPPTMYLKKDAPPCILFYGTSDAMLDHGKEYAAKCKELGVKVDLFAAADQPHGFFNAIVAQLDHAKADDSSPRRLPERRPKLKVLPNDPPAGARPSHNRSRSW